MNLKHLKTSLNSKLKFEVDLVSRTWVNASKREGFGAKLARKLQNPAFPT